MSTFGRAFRVTTYGESHCPSVGCIVDGVPPGMQLVEADVQTQLTRRRPGQSNLTTPRDEKDQVVIHSGVEHGVTLGTPIALQVRNQDQRPHDYTETDFYPRPSHADYTYLEKYGVKASSGGGRSSARETIGRVAAGAIAEKYLKIAFGIEIVAFVASVGKIHIPSSTGAAATGESEDPDFAEDALSPEYVKLLQTVTREEVDKYTTRCPHPETSEKMTQRILRAKEAQDSIGGTVVCVIRNVPAGLGEPVFDKFEAELAHAMLSIPATKGFEIGSGFKGCEVPGSRHNDPFVASEGGRLRTTTNWSGGIQGVPATISQAQSTAQYNGTAGSLAARGRHDPCVVPRAIPIVEAMAAIVVLDQLLLQQGRNTAANLLPPVTTLPPTMVFPGRR
ncbi:Chorismate synthase [Rhizoctonia solani]|uniref:Chorismate synthase n=1 Tax=Rhizoctonia solani TaxID=456999 RepID=A0A8H7M5X8_9AGAM|nr:Chorismate synthase [Rhizoctonia solani]